MALYKTAMIVDTYSLGRTDPQQRQGPAHTSSDLQGGHHQDTWLFPNFRVTWRCSSVAATELMKMVRWSLKATLVLSPRCEYRLIYSTKCNILVGSFGAWIPHDLWLCGFPASKPTCEILQLYTTAIISCHVITQIVLSPYNNVINYSWECSCIAELFWWW